jgi:lipopolysaccharide transport system permease protein
LNVELSNSSRWSSLAVVVPQGWYIFYRDFQFRYGLTLLGYFWSVVRPIASALPLIFVGRQFNLGAGIEGIPYSIYALTGIIFWNLFWDAFTMPMFLMHRTRTVLKRIPLSPSALVWATIFSALVNLGVNLIILLIAAFFMGAHVSWFASMALLSLPVLLIAGLGLGLPLVSITAVYHDMRYGVGFLGQLFLWSAPIVHSIPSDGLLRTINTYNPLTYLISAPRSWFFGLETQNVEFFWLAASFSLVLFLVGSWYYRGTIRTTYDYVV